jgi:hypothetical protein
VPVAAGVAPGVHIIWLPSRGTRLAQGDTVNLTENDNNNSKITVYIPKEWQ